MLLQFNYKISAYQLYKELNRIATFKLPTATPFLTALNQTRRRDHAEYLLASNIENWVFSDECRIQNPIEMIWAILKRLVSHQNPKSRAELIQAAKDGWDSISMNAIRNAIDNVQKKICPLVVNNHGNWV